MCSVSSMAATYTVAWLTFTLTMMTSASVLPRDWPLSKNTSSTTHLPPSTSSTSGSTHPTSAVTSNETSTRDPDMTTRELDIEDFVKEFTGPFSRSQPCLSDSHCSDHLLTTSTVPSTTKPTRPVDKPETAEEETSGH